MRMSVLDTQFLGWLAAALTLATFVCRDMRQMRLLALAANAAFIGYGAAAQLLPVLMLHLALVPVNLWRLNQALRPVSPEDAAPSPTLRARARPTRCRQPRSWRAAARSMPCIQGLATEPRLIDSGYGPLSSCASAAAKTLPAAVGSTPSARSAANAWSPSADRAAASTAAAACASSAAFWRTDS
jgi:hypothetical protein